MCLEGEFKTRSCTVLFGQSLWLSCSGGCQAPGVWKHRQPTQQGACQGNGLGFQAVDELLLEELDLFPGS